MTNQQLYLAIGLPTLTSLVTLILVCLAWLTSRASDRELRAELRSERSEFRSEIDHRFASFEARIDKRFDAVDKRFDAVDRRFDAVDRRFDAIDAELRYFHGTAGNHEARLNFLEKK